MSDKYLRIKSRYKHKHSGGWSDEELEEAADSIFEFVKKNASVWPPKRFLKIEWCLDYGMRHDRVAKLARRNEKFGNAVKLLTDFQECVVTKGALTGTICSKFAVFMLSCNHGWRPEASKDAEQFAKGLLGELVDNAKKRMKEAECFPDAKFDLVAEATT